MEKPPSHWSMRCIASSKPSLTLRPIAPNPRWECQHHPIKSVSVPSPQPESDNSSRQFGLVRSPGVTAFKSVEAVITRASLIPYPARAYWESCYSNKRLQHRRVPHLSTIVVINQAKRMERVAKDRRTTLENGEVWEMLLAAFKE